MEEALTPEDEEASLTEQRRMIDKLVDFGIARYLEKSRRQIDNEIENNPTKRDVSLDLRSLLHDWMTLGNDEKEKRTCPKEERNKSNFAASRKFTTPKPGTIIKDKVQPNDIVLYEAPLRDELLKSNVSDIGFQEGGDVIPIGIDTSREKVYHGEQAAKMIAELAHHNATKRNQDIMDNDSSIATTKFATLVEGSTPGTGPHVSNKTTAASTSTTTPKT